MRESNADPNEDQFAKRMKAKKERVSKNELQRLRNLARTMKGKVPGVGLTPTVNPDKDHLNRALVAAKTSNASMGMFTETLPKENETVKSVGKKRQFLPNTSELGNEKRRSLDILANIGSAKSVVDKDKAAKVHATVVKQSFRNETGGSSSKPDRSKKFGKGKPRERDLQSSAGSSRFSSKSPNNSRKSSSRNVNRGGGQKRGRNVSAHA
jgi:regulator of ribosome biosynthesis